MNSATAENTIAEKASLPTGGKLRRLGIAVTAACILATSTSAWAKPACYSAAEYDAEQAVRLHTELMVIGLTCNAIEADRKLFSKYQQFTTKNRTSLLNWEKILIGHFSQTGKSNPTRQFDDFRTVVANEVAQRSALLTPPVFCQTHSDIVDHALSLSESDLKRYLSSEKADEIGIAPPCGVTVAELLDSDLPATAKASKPSVQGKSGDKGSKSKPAKDVVAAKTVAAKPAKTIVTAAKGD
jgi:hypothetical protein